ncbi:methyltransferase RsmF C-terminal domain-like protein [Bacteroides bouchesdurhonensis]|uniref:methyltransferase RsmF C-terminal domain-like protein n=1 Tax=Bacteroides bouchesdurhonensis TaxID=1841855 RepID=UPI00097F9989|nr:rRNA cytosine-C5-methyltransferase [Bacteroides bouchesdurhonensis]
MNLPVSFIDYTRALLGNEEYEKLAVALQQEPPVSIRINNRKWMMNHDDYSLEKVLWASEGYYLDERLTFTFDPLFHAGCYYVQEASSMFVEQILRQYAEEPVIMLDLCAAPGGKSTHLRSILPEGSLLVANEVIRNRSQILAENLTKWGHPDVVVTNNDPSDYLQLPSFFDIILTDVPCSGEGMFRKDPVAIEEWSPENVEICWQRQRRIISDIWACLKPGGILIYSTCTYNTKEDEENVRWIQEEFGAEMLSLDIPVEWKITGDLLGEKKLPVYHFLPHKTKGEGFFLAALRKPMSDDESILNHDIVKSKNQKKKDKRGGTTSAPPVSREYLKMAENWLKKDALDKYVLTTEDTAICAFSRQYQNELAILKQNLRVIQAGTAVGEVKGKDLIPAHALAMSTSVLRQGAFVTEEVTYEQAIAYLRKEAVTLPVTAPRGYILLTYRNIPLGFVKNIGNRANNLYPQEWRIRSGYLPEEVKTL